MLFPVERNAQISIQWFSAQISKQETSKDQKGPSRHENTINGPDSPTCEVLLLQIELCETSRVEWVAQEKMCAMSEVREMSFAIQMCE